MKLIFIVILNFLVISIFTMEIPPSRTDFENFINAIMMGDEILVETLLQQGANPNTIIYHEGDKVPVIVTAANEKIVKLLLEYGAQPNIVVNPSDSKPTNLLTVAISTFSPPLIDVLLNKTIPHPIKIDSPSGSFNNTPLIQATSILQWIQNNPDKFFNAHHIDPDEAQNNQKQIILKLLAAGGDPDKKNTAGVSARSLLPELIKLYTLERSGKEER